MTVRVLLQDQPQPQRRLLVWVESVLLVVGLLGLDCFVWSNVYTAYSQAYDSWSLDQQIAARPTVPAKADKLPRLEAYALIGRVEVPRAGLRAMVREGVGDTTLRTAVGHVPVTALPGQPGNVALAAHRDTLFRKLRGIRKNDRISIETVNGTFDYVVESWKVVQPTDVSVLKSTKDGEYLTLITCYPFNYIGAAPKRFVVRARQVNVTAQNLRRPA